jgi:type IV secretory pathway VirB3-like protein
MREGPGIDALRLAEAAGEAAAVLGVTALPVAWRMLDTSLVAVLTGMLALFTIGIYALHAVTFDCFRMTGHRPRQGFSYTQRED